MRRPHPGLQRAEDVLDCSLAYARGFRRAVQSCLDRLDHSLVLPTSDASVWGRRALGLEVAAWTRRRPVLVQGLAVLNPGEPVDRGLPSRAPVDITACVIDEVALVEPAMELAVRGQWLRHQRFDARLLAFEDVVALEVTTIRQHRRLGCPIASLVALAIAGS